MLRKLIVSGLLALTLVVCGCAVVLPVGETTQPAHQTVTGKGDFDCKTPEGRSYWCYNDEECFEYFNGYNMVLRDRFEMLRKHKVLDKPVQMVYINLWADHKELQFLGKMTGERKMDGRIWFRMWLEVYNINCELLDKSYKEGYLVPPAEEEQDYEQNSFELKALRRGC